MCVYENVVNVIVYMIVFGCVKCVCVKMCLCDLCMCVLSNFSYLLFFLSIKSIIYTPIYRWLNGRLSWEVILPFF